MQRKNTLSVSCITMLVGVISCCVHAQSLEEKIQRARSIINSRMQQSETALSNIQTLSDSVSKRQEALKNKAKEDAPVIRYSIQRTYFNWPRVDGETGHEDYIIRLDYAQQAHSDALDEQFQEWIQDGWFISESRNGETEDDDPNNLSILLVRIIRT